MTTVLVTLKKPIIMELANPMQPGTAKTEKVVAFKYTEATGKLGEMYTATDVAWSDAKGGAQWWRDWYGLTDNPTTFRLSTAGSNIEGAQYMETK